MNLATAINPNSISMKSNHILIEFISFHFKVKCAVIEYRFNRINFTAGVDRKVYFDYCRAVAQLLLNRCRTSYILIG